MSSRSTSQRHPLALLGRWVRLPMLLGLCIGLLAVEGALRLLEIRTGDLGVLTTTATTHAERLATGPDRDLIVLGSSSAGADIWIPDLEADGAACDGYVAWLPSASMDDLVRFTTESVLSEHDPTRLLFAVTMREFVPSPTDGGAGLTDETGEGWFERHVRLIRARPTLQDPFQFGLAVEQGLAEELTLDGNQVIMQDRVIADESPEHREQERRRMADYRFEQRTYDRFAELLATVRAHGSEPIVVALPVTGTFVGLAPGGEADSIRHHEALAEIASAQNVELIDLTDLPLDVATQFADVNHLNAAGRAALTAALASELSRCPNDAPG